MKRKISTASIAADKPRVPVRTSRGSVPRARPGRSSRSSGSVSEEPAGDSTEARAKRIIETAIELAEEGGFEAVRLRDVAAHAGVALGTLYRRFPSKEALLIAALEAESDELERRLGKRVGGGQTPLDRVTIFFAHATPGLCRRPNLARAVLRAIVSGEGDVIVNKSAAFHARMVELIAMALRGRPEDETDAGDAGETELRKIAYVLQQVWFAGLVGWMVGILSQAEVMEQVNTAADLVLGGRRDST